MFSPNGVLHAGFASAREPETATKKSNNRKTTSTAPIPPIQHLRTIG
jgi:hypothetical protein